MPSGVYAVGAGQAANILLYRVPLSVLGPAEPRPRRVSSQGPQRGERQTIVTVTRVPNADAPRFAAQAAHNEYRRHLDSGCERCSVPVWCAVESELDFAADVAVRRAYGHS